MPVVNQTFFDWIVWTNQIVSDDESFLLATIPATSSRPLTFKALNISSEPEVRIKDMGIFMRGNEFRFTQDILTWRYELKLPVFGFISITDDGTSCIDESGISTPGPCSLVVKYSLNLITDILPECPRDIVSYSFENYPSIEWAEPIAKYYNFDFTQTVEQSFRVYPWTPSIPPGSKFPYGVTTVLYQLNTVYDLTQRLETRVQCEFTVCV
jgi:hypothetical protein